MQMALINRIKNNKTILHGGMFTFFSFANQGVSFVLLLVLANYIGPGEYGQLNLFVIFVQLFSKFITLGGDGYISVAYFKKNRNDFRITINTVLLTSLVILISFLLTVSLFSDFFTNAIGLKLKYLWAASLICFMTVLNNLNLNIWIFEEKPVSYGLYSLAMVALNFVITLLLVISFNEGWLGRLHAQVYVTTFFFIISAAFLLYRKYLDLKQMPDKMDFKETLSYGIPLVPNSVAGWLRQGADRYIINSYLTISTVGLYSFAMNFSNIVSTVGMAFNQTNVVYLYKNLSNGYLVCKERLCKRERLMSIIYLVLTIAVSAICYFFIPIILPKYRESAVYVFPLCFAAMFGSLYTLFVNYLLYYGKTKQLMYITVISSIFQLGLSFLLTRYSAMYTAMVFMVSQALVFIGVYVYSKQLLKKQENIELLKLKNNE